MGAGGEDLLVLDEQPRCAPGRPPRRPLPLRAAPSLARGAGARRAAAAATRTPISGASDHGISEAIYLPDPDGNGIELAADRGARALGRPRATRPRWRPGAARRGRAARLVDGRGAAAEAPGPASSATCTCTSATSSAALAFYRDVIGFEVMTLARRPPSSPPAATTTTSASISGAARARRRRRPAAVGLRHWTSCSPPRTRRPCGARIAAGAGRGAARRPVRARPWNNALLVRAED